MFDKLPADMRIKKAKISLMRDPTFALWSGLLMIGNTEVIDDFPTAATNGRDEIYGKKFVESLSEPEIKFLILHENLHKAFRHLTLWYKLAKLNPMVTNMACDHVINLILYDLDPTEAKLKHPRMPGTDVRMGCHDERFRGMNTKQVYDILMQELEQSGGTGDGGTGEGGEGGKGGKGFDEHDWEGAKGLSKTDTEAVEREVDQALRQGRIAHERHAGKGAGNLDRALDELLTPKLDWRELLREFVASTCNAKDASSWRRVNRRFIQDDIYMPTLIGEKMDSIAVLIDTSGSIGQDELTACLTEVKAIADIVHPERVEVIYWDHAVAGHETYTGSAVDNIIASTKPRGGGGTDPTCAMNYLLEKKLKPQCILVLTDGYVGTWGDKWDAPILWGIIGGNKVTAPIGKTLYIED